MQNKIKVCHICDRITGKSDGVFAHLLIIVAERFDNVL